jgi:hypothetical protein
MYTTEARAFWKRSIVLFSSALRSPRGVTGRGVTPLLRTGSWPIAGIANQTRSKIRALAMTHPALYCTFVDIVMHRFLQAGGRWTEVSAARAAVVASSLRWASSSTTAFV